MQDARPAAINTERPAASSGLGRTSNTGGVGSVRSPPRAVLGVAVLAAIAGMTAAGGAAASQRATSSAPEARAGDTPGTLSARAIVTTSIYGLTPLSVIPSSVGAYYLRITYEIPCSLAVILTAQISAPAKEVNLHGDGNGYLEEWSTQSGGGPSGQQIPCGSAHIATNDFAPADWSGRGPVTFTIDAIVESDDGASADRTVRLAQTTVLFVDTQ